jgi:head-tail adaptor
MENAKPSSKLDPSRSRSRSRPRRPEHQLHRILSSHFPDDHSVYHHEDGEGLHVDTYARSLHRTETQRRGASTSSSSDGDSADNADEKEEPSEERDEAARGDEVVREEIRGGIPYEHDVEASPRLEEKKSVRSVRDPNLVSAASRIRVSRTGQLTRVR